ncbi:toxin-antitoxin system YwqK family antitoxin [uncultured Paraglaciecola sp.]|uniref:toxin-antitoxin system YwqK family antitoxin n=1 Tax=uncultured Paraglaciecola sp. TaxID=1765024 RepID=UPI0030DA7021
MILIKSRLGIFEVCCLLVALAVICISVWIHLQGPLIVDKSEISINQKGQRVYQNQAFTGEMVSYHTPGKLATADQFVNGRRHGYARKWFADGLLGYESHYVSGAREGITRSWWFNGNPRSETFFVKGKSEGVAWHWYRSGAKFKRYNTLAGKPVGLQQAWRKNGTLFSNFEYKNGRIYGLRKANNCVGLENEVISPDYYASQDY